VVKQKEEIKSLEKNFPKKIVKPIVKKTPKKISKPAKKLKPVVKKNPVEKSAVVSHEANFPTMNITSEKDIAMDFATKVYTKFNKIIKSIVLFGSSAKKLSVEGSDIDIIIIIDDCTIQWDEELIAWYREELGKVIKLNPYKKSLHINSVKLSTWWDDLLRGDPVVVNVLRWGEALIDFGGFFNPLKVLLSKGKIQSTPEAIFTALQRAPAHMARSKASFFAALDGVYWAMVDSAHAALIAAKQMPPSPEEIPNLLAGVFVEKKMLDRKYVMWYKDIYELSHKILHGDYVKISGNDISLWQQRADEFIGVMATLVKKVLDIK
jgi:predicted nucleotidyltransferase/uncharacterized protein (UPF0332 family)